MALFLTKNRTRRHGEEGYVLLTMLLTVSLMTIAALAVLPDMIFELRRDQEQEMIHRGVQYTRAIRAYYRKFGRYPTRLEDLDSSNNLRFLRKHYKDPLTGKDFRLLHYGEPGLSIGGSIGGLINGATPAGAAMNSSSGSSFGNSFGSSSGSSFGSSFGNSSSGNSSFGNSGFGGASGNSGVNSNGVFAQSSVGGNSNGNAGGSNSQNGSNVRNADSSDPNAQVTAENPQEADASSGQQLVASGPILGVASTSKKKTIRIYNKKTKYNEWQFIYDPTADRGGLITTPYQPPLQGMAGQSLQPGQNTSQNGSQNSNSPFGNSNGSSFGQSSGQSSFGQSSFGQSGFGQSSSGQSGFGNNSNSGSNSPNPPQ